jgi:hypothetical protein
MWTAAAAPKLAYQKYRQLCCCFREQGMPEHAIGGSPSEEDTMSESSEEAEVAELQGGPSQSDSLEAQWEECIKYVALFSSRWQVV